MTPVEAYFRRTGTNANVLSSTLGCSPSTIYRMLKGDRPANTEFALSVERATNGELTASDFLSSCLAAAQAPPAGEAN